jgi:hypothetical protein
MAEGGCDFCRFIRSVILDDRRQQSLRQLRQYQRLNQTIDSLNVTVTDLLISTESRDSLDILTHSHQAIGFRDLVVRSSDPRFSSTDRFAVGINSCMFLLSVLIY